MFLQYQNQKTKYPNMENIWVSDALSHFIFLPQFLQLSKSTLWGPVKKLFTCSILKACSFHCSRNYVKCELWFFFSQKKMVCLESKYKYGLVTENTQVILLKKYFTSALHYIPSVCSFCTYLLNINNGPL